MYKNLLMGCGNSREKKVRLEGETGWTGELVTMDMDPNCGADVVLDIGLYASVRLPFNDAEFDEVHAYDSLEHWGRQGDWRSWFDECSEYWRILKPGGLMGIIVPINGDALADPGHTRFFGANHFYMLNQQWYVDCLSKGLPVTDYRWYFEKNFEIVHLANEGNHHLVVMLRKA